MGHNSSLRKSQTLGMPHGTASGKLRKKILFHLLQKHDENICFKCNEKIAVVDELSIEHKKPWEGISSELFWDLENIAFSHMRCNRPHRLGSAKIRTPDGTAWCSGHQKALPVSEFFVSSAKDDGLDVYCKTCRREKDTRQNHAKKI